MKNMNKKGSGLDVIVWMILALVVLVFFGLYLYGFNIVADELLSLEFDVGDTNFSSVADQPINAFRTAQDSGLHLIAFAMIFGYAIAILITAYYSKSNPIFFILHIIVIGVAVVVSAVISNTYEELLNDSTFGATLSGFSGSNFIMMNLPLFVVLIGVGITLLVFLGLNREEGGVF